MAQTKVFGHKAPDTDTVCSAIIFSWFLNAQKGIDTKPYRLGELNKETQYVLERWGVEIPELLEGLEEGDTVAIVDTNNPDELPEGLENVQITDIVDHHKLAGIVTNGPLTVNLRPLGCTASIIYCMAKKNDLEMPEKIKQLTLSCILSDTLMFRSPTTTKFEREYAEELSKDLSVEIEELANEMFDHKSDLSGMSAEDLLNVDSKIYEMHGKKVKVSVLETTKPENTLAMKTELIELMKNYKAEGVADEVFFFAIDILNEESTAVFSSIESGVWLENAFKAKVSKDTVVLTGVVSRKKQIVPELSK